MSKRTVVALLRVAVTAVIVFALTFLAGSFVAPLLLVILAFPFGAIMGFLSVYRPSGYKEPYLVFPWIDDK